MHALVDVFFSLAESSHGAEQVPDSAGETE